RGVAESESAQYLHGRVHDLDFNDVLSVLDEIVRRAFRRDGAVVGMGTHRLPDGFVRLPVARWSTPKLNAKCLKSHDTLLIFTLEEVVRFGHRGRVGGALARPPSCH